MAAATLNPMTIKKLGNRTVRHIYQLGDGFTGFLLRTLEDGETVISNPHFQSTVHDIVAELKDHDMHMVPRESLDLIIEKMQVHHVHSVDMVIPFRIPPDRGNYLKYNPRHRRYEKRSLIMNQLHVEGEFFLVIAMDPLWQPGD